MRTPDFEETLLGDPNKTWMMTPGERATLHFMLEHHRPSTSIEIGTAFGGSLSVIAPYSQKVYSFDLDPNCGARLEGVYPNVEYIVGDSHETFPKVMTRIPDSEPLGFVLVDGGHEYETVLRDLSNIVAITPIETLFVVMHDSFIPGVRKAILDTPWAENPHVHSLHLDFVNGNYGERGTLACGFALATFRPNQ